MAKKLNRRHLIAAGVVAAGAAALAVKPKDQSGPRDPYFTQLQAALRAASIATPTLVIDKTRLNANIDTLTGDLPQGMGYRIVAKSLPCLQLIDHIRRRAGTTRLMTFNLPMLQDLARYMPESEQLLGKPLPVAAFKTFMEKQSPENIQWLIDTPERLRDYADIARSAGAKIKVNLELDVGLHRGGFVPGEALGQSLKQINEDDSLIFAGFMGYEPHIAKLPTAGMRKKSLRSAWDIYLGALGAASSVFSQEIMGAATRNAAGSPTYKLYKNTDIANEVSAGSALVKPTDFDTDLLSTFLPASFIATPVIKSLNKTQIPGLESVSGLQRFWNPNLDKTVFIYGGHWLAKPEDPPGLRHNSLFGQSSNQEMLNGGPEIDVKPGDFVFLRPKQSEAVFLQFGDIAIYDEGRIVDFWPVFPASA